MPLPLVLVGAVPLLTTAATTAATIGGAAGIGGLLLGAGARTTTVASPFITLASLRADDADKVPDWVKEKAVGFTLFVVTELIGLGIRALEKKEKDERYLDYEYGVVAVSDVEAIYTENVEESWRVCIRTRIGRSYFGQSFNGDNAEHLATEKVNELAKKFSELLAGYGRTS